MSGADLYARALHFAARAHGAQLTPHGVPYVVHLACVCMELERGLRAEPGHDEDLAIACALLHDSVEDTETTREQVAAEFGAKVADGVAALSKDPAVEKTQRLDDSLRRIVAQPAEVAMVKLADRITNLGPPPPQWSAEKRASYKAEAQRIHDALGAASPFLAARLRERIAAYPG